MMVLLGDEHLDELMCLEAPECLSLGLDGRQYRTDALSAARGVASVSRFVRNAIEALDEGELGTPALDELARALVNHVQDATAYFPAHSFNPYFEAVLGESQSKAYEHLREFQNVNDLSALKADLQKFACAIRDRCTTRKFAAQLDGRRRRLHSTIRSARMYASEMLFRASYVLVCHTDFFWSKGHPRPEIPAPCLEDFDSFRTALRKLVRYLQNRYCDAGYFYKIEYARNRGFVARMFAFVPESNGINARDVAGDLGRHWSHSLSKGQGGYAHRSWGAKPGLEPIGFNDTVATSVLDQALRRTLGGDFWLRLTLTPRTFERGQLRDESRTQR